MDGLRIAELLREKMAGAPCSLETNMFSPPMWQGRVCGNVLCMDSRGLVMR
jgi:hypothetical protein